MANWKTGRSSPVPGPKAVKPRTAIAGVDEYLHEASGFVEGAGAEGGGHGDLAEAVGDSLLLCFVFGAGLRGRVRDR